MPDFHQNLYRTAVSGCLVITLTACGGGGGGGSGSATDNSAALERIKQAMSSANSNLLTQEDAAVLLSEAQNNYKKVLSTQNALLADFYAYPASTRFDLVKESSMVQPSLLTKEKVFPLVVGDKGYALASISMVGDGRIAGYGYDILAGFSPQSKQQTTYSVPQTSHQTVFKRVLAWLVTGNANADISTSSAKPFSVAWGSLPTSSTVMYTTPAPANRKVYEPFAMAGMHSLGVNFTPKYCDPLADPVDTCAGTSNLVVIGAIDWSDSGKLLLPTQLDRLKEIIAKKIPILYLHAHPNYSGYNDFARAVETDDYPRLAAMGFASGDDIDRRNLYKQDSVGTNLTLSQIQQRSNPWEGALGGLIERLMSGNFTNYSWPSDCNALSCVPVEFVNQVVTPVTSLKSLMDKINTNQIKLFDSQNQAKTLQSLVLWADVYRQSINYPLNKAGNQAEFQKAYIADALVAYVRSAGAGQDAGTAAGQGKVGNFLGNEAKNTPTSTDFETITVTLPGSSGFTAIGRFALPGVPVEVKLDSLPAAGSKFTFFFNPIRSGSTKLWETPKGDRDGYRRPVFLQSPQFSLSTDVITRVSPYGGTLQLGYDGASATSVTLQIKGTAKHPFYDTTQGQPDAAKFFVDVKASKLGWMEIKTPGLEVHSLISNAMDFLQPSLTDKRTDFPTADKPYYNSSTGIDMAKYLDEAKKYVMEDAYQLAGFQTRGLTLSTPVQDFCKAHSWDCTSPSIHAPPTVQHYVSDIRANCGSMCSGQPIDSGSAFDPRHWGESHEMGHNLQALYVYDGISSEVSNNIFPLHKKWRLFRELGRNALGYSDESTQTQTVFDLIKNTYKDSTNSSRDAKMAKVKADLWSDDGYAAQNWSRLYFYLQWPLIYYEVVKESHPLLPDAQAWDQAWDIYTLMYVYLRQLNAAPSDANWSNVRGKFGFGLYPSKPSTGNSVDSNGNYPVHDVMLVGLSLITGRNQTPIFDLWGVSTTTAARNQAAALNLSSGQLVPSQATKFYAVVCFDDYRTYAAIDLNATNPGFPDSWGATPFADAKTNIKACTQATTAYEQKP